MPGQTRDVSGMRTVNHQTSALMQFVQHLYRWENSAWQTIIAKMVLIAKILNAKRTSNSKVRYAMKTMNALETSYVTTHKGQNLSGEQILYLFFNRSYRSFDSLIYLPTSCHNITLALRIHLLFSLTIHS